MKITGGELSQKEITAYREYVEQNRPGRELIGIHIVDSEFVDLETRPIPFERLRRITGYLVGSTDRWNSGKLAEMRDRVPHVGGKEDKH